MHQGSPANHARSFDMDTADPLPIPLSEYMADKEPVWKSLAPKHGLLDLPYEHVASWYFGDAILTAPNPIDPLHDMKR
jgi:hypothetical protein